MGPCSCGALADESRILFYFGWLVVFGIGILAMLQWGARLHPSEAQPAQRTLARVAGPLTDSSIGGANQPAEAPSVPLHRHPLEVLILQLIVILAAAHLTGSFFCRLGQPAVLGEMTAGILLGPSLLGMTLPGVQGFLFPTESLAALKLLSEIGVVLFMFLVGMDLDLGLLRRRAGAALVVSHASMVVPFFLGIALSLLLYPRVAPTGVSFAPFALFTGTAMSITAFPVLARILRERGMSGTELGSTALACAAVDDATAWCLLAAVVAIAGSAGLWTAAGTLSLAALFAAGMLFGVKPALARHASLGGWGGGRNKALLAAVLVLLLGCALLTELIGIHAMFGSFLAGVVVPARKELREFLRERLEAFTSVFLLPLFFAFTGLHTQVGLLSDASGWLLCACIIAVAILGKLGGSFVAARAAGLAQREALALGVLMNARGLVELVALNIGYEMGVLSPRLFTMMVLMALVTTGMTGPLLSWLKVGKEAEALTARAGVPA